MKAVILVSGKMRSGKNLFAERFAEISTSPVNELAFAGPLKKMCYDAFSKLNKVQSYDYSNWDTKKDDITRAILTGVGTDIIQNILGLNSYWVDKTVDTLAKRQKTEAILKDAEFQSFQIVTDARYEHEIEGVRDLCYNNAVPLYIIRINRATEQTEHNKVLETHTSETALDGYPCFSYIIENNGTLDEYYDAIANVYNDILEDIS